MYNASLRMIANSPHSTNISNELIFKICTLQRVTTDEISNLLSFATSICKTVLEMSLTFKL